VKVAARAMAPSAIFRATSAAIYLNSVAYLRAMALIWS
jgi:hypothetical protein